PPHVRLRRLGRLRRHPGVARPDRRDLPDQSARERPPGRLRPADGRGRRRRPRPARSRALGRGRRRRRRALPAARAAARLRQDVAVSTAGRFRWSSYAALVAFLLFQYFPTRQLLDSASATWHVALVLAGIAVFDGLYLSLMVAPGTALA